MAIWIYQMLPIFLKKIILIGLGGLPHNRMTWFFLMKRD